MSLQEFQSSLSSPHLHSPPLRFHMPWLSLALCSLPAVPSIFLTSFLGLLFFRPLVWVTVGTESHLSGIWPSSWPKRSRRLHRLSKPYSKGSCQISLFSLFPLFSDHNCWSYLLFVISSRDIRIKKWGQRAGSCQITENSNNVRREMIFNLTVVKFNIIT